MNKPTIFNMMKIYLQNKELIFAYYKKQSIEHYNEKTLLGMTIPMFTFVLVITLLMWIFGIVITFTYWKVLPIWSKLLALYGLIAAFISDLGILALKDPDNVEFNKKQSKKIQPIVSFVACLMTIVVVYIGKSEKYSINRHDW